MNNNYKLKNMKQQQQQLDLTLTGEIICDNCQNNTFEPIFYLRSIPRTMSQTGKEEMYPIQSFACKNCGHVNENMKIKIPQKKAKSIKK